nr:DUF6508 domain-containing protein [Bacillus altitudinis]
MGNERYGACGHFKFKCTVCTCSHHGVLRAERFSEGAIFNFFKSGAILKWLERLKNLDV